MEPYFRIIVLVITFFVGAILGSFACCQAWRLRLKELHKKSPGKWSVCLSCGKRLKKSENIPIFSWLAQKGKCKKCGAKIGFAEILSELSFGIALTVIANSFFDQFSLAIASNNTPSLIMLVLTALVLAICMSIMWILIIYDAKWQALPTFLLIILNICALIYVIVSVISLLVDGGSFSEIGPYLLRTFGSALLLAGPYFLLSTISKEKLVGSGDWLIALPVALILGHWWLALITLFLSNALGAVFGMYLKVHQGKRQIPFGPFLVIAFIIVYTIQSWLLSLIVII